MLFSVHINKIYYDNTADIAQPQLTSYFFGSLSVNLHNGFFQTFTSAELAAVNINNGHRFRIVNNKIASAWQRYLSV